MRDARNKLEGYLRDDRLFEQRRALERGDREGFILGTGYYIPQRRQVVSFWEALVKKGKKNAQRTQRDS